MERTTNNRLNLVGHLCPYFGIIKRQNFNTAKHGQQHSGPVFHVCLSSSSDGGTGAKSYVCECILLDTRLKLPLYWKCKADYLIQRYDLAVSRLQKDCVWQFTLRLCPWNSSFRALTGAAPPQNSFL